MMTQPLAAAIAKLGHSGLRGPQVGPVEALTQGHDVLAIMATGQGKSLCFQAPALARGGCAIVLSPLIALMKNQVDELVRRGLRAVAVNSLLEADARAQMMRQAESGALDFIYAAPETAVAPWFRATLKSLPAVSLVAVDEAHCVSQWGHDFRPEYRQIAALRGDCIPFDTPMGAFTATADPDTRVDIADNLELRDPRIFRNTGDRPNVALAIERRGSRERAVARIAEVRSAFPTGAGVVYCHTRKATIGLSVALRGAGVRAIPFHAMLGDDEKRRALERFTSGEKVTVVATIAFGMGIDRKDVRFVVHQRLARGPESYLQESGRAGRDGLPSFALMLYEPGDADLLMKFAKEARDGHVRAREIARVEAMLELAQGQSCRRRQVLSWFHESIGDCGQCDRCLGSVDLAFERTLARYARRSPSYDELRAARQAMAKQKKTELWRIARNSDLEAIVAFLQKAPADAALPASLAKFKPLIDAALNRRR